MHCRPMYLLLNVAGPAKYRNKPNSHFNPHSALFKASQAPDITKVCMCVCACMGESCVVTSCLCVCARAPQSDLGIFVALGVFAYCVLTFGWNTVCALYFIPYLIVNAHLVLITYLQHTAPYIPHYRNVRAFVRACMCAMCDSAACVSGCRMSLTGCVARCQRWTAPSGPSSTMCSTTSRTHTSHTTCSTRCHSIMRRCARP